VLSSSFSISILSSIVGRSRWPRKVAHRNFPCPRCLHHLACGSQHHAASRNGTQTDSPDAHSRIERRAARGGGGTGVGGRSPGRSASGGMGGLEARVRWSAQKRWLATNPGCISISAKWRTASVSQCRAIRTLASVITVQALRVRRSESSALRLSSTGAGGQQV
jgi:hypothetical protein